MKFFFVTRGKILHVKIYLKQTKKTKAWKIAAPFDGEISSNCIWIRWREVNVSLVSMVNGGRSRTFCAWQSDGELRGAAIRHAWYNPEPSGIDRTAVNTVFSWCVSICCFDRVWKAKGIFNSFSLVLYHVSLLPWHNALCLYTVQYDEMIHIHTTLCYIEPGW